MKINMKQVIKNLDEEDMKVLDEKTKVEKVLTLSLVCAEAILQTTRKDTENTIGGVEKLKRFDIAHRIWSADGDVSLESEEITLIKDRVSEVYPPLVVGRVYHMWEGE